MSGGVPPALKFAEMFPDRTDRLVLLSSAPFTPFSPVVEDRPIPTWAYTTLLGNDAVYWALTKVARGPLRSAFDARGDLMADVPANELQFVDRLINGFLPASARLAGVENEGAAVDSRAEYRLEAIRAPTLILHTRDDSLNPAAVGEQLGSAFQTLVWSYSNAAGTFFLATIPNSGTKSGALLGRQAIAAGGLNSDIPVHQSISRLFDSCSSHLDVEVARAVSFGFGPYVAVRLGGRFQAADILN